MPFALNVNKIAFRTKLKLITTNSRHYFDFLQQMAGNNGNLNFLNS